MDIKRKRNATEGKGLGSTANHRGELADGYADLVATRKKIMARRISVVLLCAVAVVPLTLFAGSLSWLVAMGAVAAVGIFLAVRNEADAQMSVGSAELFEKLAESLPGMVYQCRLYPTGKCVVTYANAALGWIYEQNLADMQRDCSVIMDLVHPHDRERVLKSLAESARNLTPWKGEYRVVLPRQGIRWRSAHARVERLVDGSTLWHGFVGDVTAQKEVEERSLAEVRERTLREAREAAEKTERQKVEMLSTLNRDLQEEAIHDSLTGVYVRRYFDTQFPEVFGRMRRKEQSITLLFCDIDFFKSYNDFFGHLAGDACLRAVAQVMATEVNRGEQFVARYGGEEFVALLPGLGPNRCNAVAEKVRRAVEELNLKKGLGSEAGVVTISIGMACLEVISEEMRPELLLREADQALYDAKKAGRNRVCERILSRRQPGVIPPVREILRRAFDPAKISLP